MPLEPRKLIRNVLGIFLKKKLGLYWCKVFEARGQVIADLLDLVHQPKLCWQGPFVYNDRSKVLGLGGSRLRLWQSGCFVGNPSTLNLEFSQHPLSLHHFGMHWIHELGEIWHNLPANMCKGWIGKMPWMYIKLDLYMGYNVAGKARPCLPVFQVQASYILHQQEPRVHLDVPLASQILSP